MSDKPIQYSAAKLKKFKAILEDKLKATKEELATKSDNQVDQKERLANNNTDFNENSKHFQQQAKNKQLIRRLQRKESELKSALKRVENKTYGVCKRSGVLIREERLIAMPTARFEIQKNK